MGISVIKVGLLVGAIILPLFVEAGSICQFGKQFWSSKTGTCVDCTKCRTREHEVVIRPCHVHADTICGPISALKLEWPGYKQHDHHKLPDVDKQIHHKKNHIHHHHHHPHDFNFHSLPMDNLEQNPLKNIEEWGERLLKQSKAKLQHRKEDLMKSILERKNAAKHHSQDWEDEDFDDINAHEHFHGTLTTRRPHISKLDLEIYEKLVNSEHKNRNTFPIKPLSLVDEQLNPVDHKSAHEKSDSSDDFPELYDFMAIVPTHRLFLGEPSTVPEMMMDQAVRSLEQSVSSERIPFTTAERFVWDWQAVALISAILACILFFALAAVYSILHARQWRRIKSHFNVDAEDLALRVSLMNSGLNNSSSPDVSSSNHYLEQLIAEKKLGEKKSNIYIEKQPS